MTMLMVKEIGKNGEKTLHKLGGGGGWGSRDGNGSWLWKEGGMYEKGDVTKEINK
jgi:hypothetical protein